MTQIWGFWESYISNIIKSSQLYQILISIKYMRQFLCLDLDETEVIKHIAEAIRLTTSYKLDKGERIIIVKTARNKILRLFWQ
jgi:hypothetical protein